MNIFHDKQDEREPDFSSFDIELFGDMADNAGFYDGCVATWRKYALPLHDKIASLESQLSEKERIISEWKKLAKPILEWGQSKESGLRPGESIPEAIVKIAKESKEKDKEIERLKNDLEDMTDVKQGRGPTALSNCLVEINDLREALRELYLAFTGPYVLKPNHELTDKCRKLIE